MLQVSVMYCGYFLYVLCSMDAYIGQHVKFPSYLRQVPHINDNFILRRAVGKGTFGVVFLGVLKGVESERYAFKFLVPTSCLTAYQSEIKVLTVVICSASRPSCFCFSIF